MHDMPGMWVLDNLKEEGLCDVLYHLSMYLRTSSCCQNSAVNTICYGAKLMLPGVLNYDADNDVNDECVLMTTGSGAIGICQMSTAVIATCDHGSRKGETSCNGARYLQL